MARFNYNDPRYQREIQRANAKAGMSGNIPKTEPISGRHAAYQLGRQLQRQGLALQSGMKKTQHEMNLARLKQADRRYGLQNERFNLFKRATKDRLDHDKENMDWTIGLGIGQLGYGALEGQRRKKILQTELSRKEQFARQYEDMIINNQQDYYNSMHGGPLGDMGL